MHAHGAKKGNCEKNQESRTHGTIISSESSSLDAQKVKSKSTVKSGVETCVSIFYGLYY